MYPFKPTKRLWATVAACTLFGVNVLRSRAKGHLKPTRRRSCILLIATRKCLLLAAACALLFCSSSSWAQFIYDAERKIEPALLNEMAGQGGDTAIIVGVWLRQKYDPNDEMVAYRTAGSDEQRAASRGRAKQKIAATEQPLVNWLAARGRQPIYQCRYAPLVFVGMPGPDILAAAARPDVDRVHLSTTNEPAMEHAEKAVRADVVWARGINGSPFGAVVAVIEVPEDAGGSRVAFTNPYLTHLVTTGSFNPGGATSQHATSVAGVIAAATDGSVGNHGRYRGVAYGTGQLLSGNADSGSDFDEIEATEWAVGQGVQILNLSWGGDNGGVLRVQDRYYDYLARNSSVTVVVTAGNRAGGPGTGNVGSPGTAYNVITVGSFRSSATNRWTDDRMSTFSSFVGPPGRQKPELVAAGEDENGSIHRLSDTGDAVQSLGPGTSFAAPAVTGTCVLLADRNFELLSYPRVMKAIVMASACHNIEGDPRLSNKDGVGALVVCEADEVALKHQYHHATLFDLNFQPDATDPIPHWPHTINLDAGDGAGPPKTARVVLTWDSNPSRLLIARTSTGLTATTLTDMNEPLFPFGAVNSKVGWFLQPDSTDPHTFRVRSNNALTLTVTEGDMTDNAVVGDTYALFQHPDDPPLDANLDLRIWDVTAGAYVAGADSNSVGDNYEISRFVPAHTGEYEVRVFNTTFNGTSESIGIAWAQEPCCSPDFGDAPDDMLPCLPRPRRGDFWTRIDSVGASVREFEVEWLSKDSLPVIGATWEMDAWVHGREAEKDQDGKNNINLPPPHHPPVCLPNEDNEDGGVEVAEIYFANQKGRVTFWVNSATPNIGRYSEERADEKIHVRGWFDWEHDDVSWAGNQMVAWRGGPTVVGVMLDGQTCIEGCDLWEPIFIQKKVTIEFAVPDFLHEGPFWIRFRASYGDVKKMSLEDYTITYAANSLPTYVTSDTWRGLATYGEVEDYTSYQAKKLEVDHSSSSEAVVTINFGAGPQTVTLCGPTTVNVDLFGLADTDNDGLEQVSTELVEMNLSGFLKGVGPITMRVRPVSSAPFLPSIGEIEEKENLTPELLDLPPFTSEGAASTFFDVFFEIEVGELLLHNNDAMHMEAQITHKPPDVGESYVAIIPQHIELFDEANNPIDILLEEATYTPLPVAPFCDGNADCDDGDPCNGAETCANDGTCVLGDPPICDDNNPCTDDFCDTAGVGCFYLTNVGPCEDGNACTILDSCSAGECIPGDQTDCDDGNPCSVDSCDPLVGCINLGDATLCDDKDPCTDDFCDVEVGGCSHTPKACDDGNPCTNDACDPEAGCTHDDVVCGNGKCDTPCEDCKSCSQDCGECPVCGDCPTDVDGSGNTGAFDLAILLGNWGPIPPDADPAVLCLDADDDGAITAFDLAVLLGGWGECP